MPPIEGGEGDSGEPSYAAVFAGALLDPDLATPAAVAGPKSKAARKRYNVYRNNVTVSLINALAAVFPATLRITGGDFFRAMARFYVTFPTSSNSTNMRNQCHGWRMWRGSSGHGSTHTTPPIFNRSCRTPWLPSLRSSWQVLF